MAETPSKKEEVKEEVVRKSKNAWTAVRGFFGKSAKQVQILVKKGKLRGLKKDFGLKYLNAVEKEAPLDELQTIVDKAKDEMATILKEIATLRSDVSNIDTETKQKLLLKKSKQEGETQEKPAVVSGNSPAQETTEPTKQEHQEITPTITQETSAPAATTEPTKQEHQEVTPPNTQETSAPSGTGTDI